MAELHGHTGVCVCVHVCVSVNEIALMNLYLAINFGIKKKQIRTTLSPLPHCFEMGIPSVAEFKFLFIYFFGHLNFRCFYLAAIHNSHEAHCNLSLNKNFFHIFSSFSCFSTHFSISQLNVKHSIMHKHNIINFRHLFHASRHCVLVWDSTAQQSIQMSLQILP